MTGAARTLGGRRAAVLGGLAAAALLPISPWAAGAEPTAVARGDAGSCRQDDLPPADAVVAGVLERLGAEPGAARRDAELVVLNNRGYNYGPPPGIDLDAILAERIRPGSGTR